MEKTLSSFKEGTKNWKPVHEDYVKRSCLIPNAFVRF